MIYNNFYNYPFPFFPGNFFHKDYDLPPTLYSIMQSIVNYRKQDKTKMSDLAKESRATIFNFDYPLDESVSRESFECMILNHFIQRRINFETMTMFNLQLNVKLNEIMPFYNKMFAASKNWELFEDGETTTRYYDTERTSDNKESNITDNKSNSITNNTLDNRSTTSTSNTSDRRYSKLPNNDLQSVRDGKYVTEYNYDSENANGTDTSNSSGNSRNDTTSNTNNQTESNTIDKQKVEEIVKRTQSDRLSIYHDYQTNIKAIYTMIFKDLECLFLQIL